MCIKYLRLYNTTNTPLCITPCQKDIDSNIFTGVITMHRFERIVHRVHIFELYSLIVLIRD
jgi:hypothetical protein